MCCFFWSAVSSRTQESHGVHRCGALLPCKSTRAISRQTSAAQGSLFDREVVIIRILFIAYENDRTGRVKILLRKCLLFVVIFRKKLWRLAFHDQLRLLFFFFRSGGERDDSARGGATCVILGTSVTTATTNSAIDEALSPCMLHLFDSVFEVVICTRSVSVHSSDCHRTNRARRVVGSLLKMRSFFCVLKSHLLVWFSHRSGLVQHGEAEPDFHEGILPIGCESMCFSRHFYQKESLYLNPLQCVRIWFQSCLVISVCLFGVVSTRVFDCRSNQSLANGLLLRVCLSLSITVFGAPRQSHFRIVSKVVLLRFSFWCGIIFPFIFNTPCQLFVVEKLAVDAASAPHAAPS